MQLLTHHIRQLYPGLKDNYNICRLMDYEVLLNDSSRLGVSSPLTHHLFSSCSSFIKFVNFKCPFIHCQTYVHVITVVILEYAPLGNPVGSLRRFMYVTSWGTSPGLGLGPIIIPQLSSDVMGLQIISHYVKGFNSPRKGRRHFALISAWALTSSFCRRLIFLTAPIQPTLIKPLDSFLQDL